MHVYDFIDALLPSSLDLTPSDPPKAVEFKHGGVLRQNGEKLVILSLSLYNDGAVIDTDSSTEHADFIASDLLRFAEEEGLDIQLFPQKFYISQLELEIEGGLERFAPALKLIGTSLMEHLPRDGIITPSYSLTSVFVNFDTLGYVGIQPSAFQLERRGNISFADNVWFCQAPLKTDDHISLLHQLDQVH